MGQIISNIVRCICGEAFEDDNQKWPNEPNQNSAPLLKSSSTLSCRDFPVFQNPNASSSSPSHSYNDSPTICSWTPSKVVLHRETYATNALHRHQIARPQRSDYAFSHPESSSGSMIDSDSSESWDHVSKIMDEELVYVESQGVSSPISSFLQLQSSSGSLSDSSSDESGDCVSKKMDEEPINVEARGLSSHVSAFLKPGSSSESLSDWGSMEPVVLLKFLPARVLLQNSASLDSSTESNPSGGSLHQSLGEKRSNVVIVKWFLDLQSLSEWSTIDDEEEETETDVYCQSVWESQGVSSPVSALQPESSSESLSDSGSSEPVVLLKFLPARFLLQTCASLDTDRASKIMYEVNLNAVIVEWFLDLQALSNWSTIDEEEETKTAPFQPQEIFIKKRAVKDEEKVKKGLMVKQRWIMKDSSLHKTKPREEKDEEKVKKGVIVNEGCMEKPIKVEVKNSKKGVIENEIWVKRDCSIHNIKPREGQQKVKKGAIVNNIQMKKDSNVHEMKPRKEEVKKEVIVNEIRMKKDDCFYKMNPRKEEKEEQKVKKRVIVDEIWMKKDSSVHEIKPREEEEEEKEVKRKVVVNELWMKKDSSLHNKKERDEEEDLNVVIVNERCMKKDSCIKPIREVDEEQNVKKGVIVNKIWMKKDSSLPKINPREEEEEEEEEEEHKVNMGVIVNEIWMKKDSSIKPIREVDDEQNVKKRVIVNEIWKKKDSSLHKINPRDEEEEEEEEEEEKEEHKVKKVNRGVVVNEIWMKKNSSAHRIKPREEDEEKAVKIGVIVNERCMKNDCNLHNIKPIEEEEQQHQKVEKEVIVKEIWMKKEICFNKPREEGKVQKVKKGVIVKEIWKNEYSSLHKILLVGDGDFSFSASLAVAFGSATNMIATSLDSEGYLRITYKRAMFNIHNLTSRGCKVVHGVDATLMASNPLFEGMRFDRVIFNFPLAGFFPEESRDSELRIHRKLVGQFLGNAKKMITAKGEIHVRHKSNGFFRDWNLDVLGLSHGLRLIEEVDFNCTEYPGYHTKYGFSTDNDFNCNPSKTYIFGLPYNLWYPQL